MQLTLECDIISVLLHAHFHVQKKKNFSHRGNKCIKSLLAINIYKTHYKMI